MPLIYAEPYSRRVIGCAIEVHKILGPGLLESIYEGCLCLEQEQVGLGFQRQPSLPVVYKGQALNLRLRPDLIVEQTLLMDIKALLTILPVHEAQMQTYLKISGLSVGLLLNFNEVRLIDGIRRRLV